MKPRQSENIRTEAPVFGSAYSAFACDIDLTRPFGLKIRLEDDRPHSEGGRIALLPQTAGPPVHLHFEQSEQFTVHAGRLELYSNGTWQILHPGEKFRVDPHGSHTYRNNTEEVCIFSYRLTPAGGFADMMRDYERLAIEGKITSLSDPRSLLHMALVFQKYKSEVRSVQPPQFVMRAMGGLARRLGLSID
jgi:quercetin dioxygenase-like cupin family protein